jgi:hypothetical protein
VLLVQFAHFEGGLAPQIVGVVRSLLILEGYLWLSRRMGLVESVKRVTSAALVRGH